MIKQATIISLFFMTLLLLSNETVPAFDLTLPAKTRTQVFFSPQGGCTQGILDSISKARSEILVQAYAFRSPAIAEALITARKRGIKVELIIDKSERQEGLTPPTLMANAGIPVYLDGQHALADNRVIIIDRKITVTGSFNFNSVSEEMNAENLLIIHSPEISNLYHSNWFDHRKHSEPF
jgi:phosphatidylserine/phosphatidylglycerophosphate/cardiolipin synthase-like enzyme